MRHFLVTGSIAAFKRQLNAVFSYRLGLVTDSKKLVCAFVLIVERALQMYSYLYFCHIMCFADNASNVVVGGPAVGLRC